MIRNFFVTRTVATRAAQRWRAIIESFESDHAYSFGALAAVL